MQAEGRNILAYGCQERWAQKKALKKIRVPIDVTSDGGREGRRKEEGKKGGR